MSAAKPDSTIDLTSIPRAVLSAAVGMVHSVERAVIGDARIRTARGNAWEAICADRERALRRDEIRALVAALAATPPAGTTTITAPLTGAATTGMPPVGTATAATAATATTALVGPATTGTTPVGTATATTALVGPATTGTTPVGTTIANPPARPAGEQVTLGTPAAGPSAGRPAAGRRGATAGRSAATSRGATAGRSSRAPRGATGRQRVS